MEAWREGSRHDKLREVSVNQPCCYKELCWSSSNLGVDVLVCEYSDLEVLGRVVEDSARPMVEDCKS